jgi:hypothetical protein
LEAIIYLEQSHFLEHIMFLHPAKLAKNCLLKREPSLEAYCLKHIKSPPSTKASAMATGGITEAATVRIKNWFKIGCLPLSSSVWEDRLLLLEEKAPTSSASWP